MGNQKKDFLEEAKRKKIVCYGAGGFLKIITSFLESEQISLAILIDSNEAKWGTQIDNVTISSPDILAELSGQDYLVLVSSKYYSKDICESIQKKYGDKFSIYTWPLGVSEMSVDTEKRWYNEITLTCQKLYEDISTRLPADEAEKYLAEKKQLLSNPEKFVLPRIPLMITTRCTLRCKECSNLMPYYCKPSDYLLEDILKWIDNLCDVVDELVCLELVGGEPFLYKDLQGLLEKIVSQKKIQRIEFTTNGTVLPNDNLMKLLSKDPRVFIKISQYPNVVDPQKIISLLEAYQIQYEMLAIDKWSKTAHLNKRNRTEAEITTQYLGCFPAKYCRTVLNGRLYACSKAASLGELKVVKDLECVDLNSRERLKERLIEFLHMNASKACYYCDYGSTEEEFVQPAIQVEKSTYLWKEIKMGQ